MNTLRLIPLIAVLALAGCSNIMPVNPITGQNKNGVKEIGTTSSIAGFVDYAKNTWGKEKPSQIYLTRVALKMNMPSHIVIQKQALGATPVVTQGDKREALLTAMSQMRVLEDGLRSKFEDKAKAYGVTISSMSADVIHVDVKSIHSFCEAYKGCKTRLGVQVRVTNVEGREVWRYEGAVEQSQPKEVVNAHLFDSFADTLLNAMELDGLIKQ